MQFPDINPILLDLGIIKIHWYGVAYMVGILCCWKLATSLLKHHHPKLPATLIDDFIPYAVMGIILGGRLGHALFYEPELLLNPGKLIAIWQGGMAFHGGIIGYILALWLYCHSKKVSLLIMADIIAITTPIGLCLGRLANFINGELYGRTTQAFLGVVFPNAGPIPRHPSQLYEAFSEGFLLFIILYLTHNTAIKHRGMLSGMFLMGYAIARSVCELFREPTDGIIYLFNIPITMGQLYTLPMILGGLWLILTAQKKQS